MRVATDAGLEGWGNVDPVGGYSTMSADDVVSTIRPALTPAPLLPRADALNPQRALAAMDAAIDAKLVSKPRRAIEMALLDLAGRAIGVPITTPCWAGASRDQVHFNAWIGTLPPEQAAREATEWLAPRLPARPRSSWTAQNPREGLARVAAVRAAVGDRLALRVDFNESLTLAEAVPFHSGGWSRTGLTLVEQPIPRDQIAGLGEIRREIGIPADGRRKRDGPGLAESRSSAVTPPTW